MLILNPARSQRCTRCLVLSMLSVIDKASCVAAMSTPTRTSAKTVNVRHMFSMTGMTHLHFADTS